MKKPLLLLFSLLGTAALAQEHFSGINLSRRGGMLNASVNPAELTNLRTDYEVSVFNVSGNAANNKITFGDLVSGDNFDEKIFAGNDATNLRVDVEIQGPGFAMKVDKWAFAISSGAKVKADLVDIDTNLGNALTNAGIDAILGGPAIINTGYNQRATATSWGEIGLAAAREIYNDEEHKFSGGVTFKLLFPGSYANMSADRFRGTISRNGSQLELTNATANVNIAYSGSLADGFENSGNYTNFFAGGLNGFAADLGVNYQWKDREVEGGYKLNAGLSVRNMGSMTFKDDNNVSTNYALAVGPNQSLNLNQFESVDDLKEVEQILEQNDDVFTSTNTTKDFKVKLPTVFSIYADVKLHNNFYATVFTQQKLNEDNTNAQISVQNIVTVTPRFSMDTFEAYLPLSQNEVSGFTAGLGFRFGGFFIGSGSALSAVVSDIDQADAYIGFRVGF